MTVSYWSVVRSHWFLYFFGIYVVHGISKFYGFDAFLFERVLSVVLVSLICFLFFWVSLNSNIKISKGALLFLFLFFLMLFYSSFISKFGYAPILFFLYSALVFLLISTSAAKFYEKSDAIEKITFLFFALHVILYFTGQDLFFQQGDRFVGFYSSPTTFATWIITLFLVSLRPSDFQGLFEISASTLCRYFLLFFLVFVTGTRTNLVLVLFLGGYLLLGGISSRKYRFLGLVSIVFMVLSVYPLYSIITIYISGDYLAYRFEGGEDTSLGLRVSLFNAVLSRMLESDLSELILGHGVEASRVLVENIWGVDIFPHNDVIRVVYDFGLIFSLIFFFSIAIVASRTELSFLICCIYIFSFVHNMVYSHYLISSIIIFSALRYKENRFK